jgi:hypothetical protein
VTKLTNHRPVPLTTFPEISETMMINRFNHQLQANNKLLSEQFGFRKGVTIPKSHFPLTIFLLHLINDSRKGLL